MSSTRHKQEAKETLTKELAKYREKTYTELCALINDALHYEVKSSNDTNYQIEIQVFWDSKPNDNIRVMGSIDDGGLRAFIPMSDDFIISPSGEFIGE